MAHQFDGFGEVSIATAGNGYDVWLGPTKKQPQPVTAGFQPSIVSSSANDDLGSIGVEEVRVIYLDTHYVQYTEDVELNGTTPVAMSAPNVIFIQCMHALQVGSNGAAVGNIDVTNGATVMKRIGIGKNRCLSSMRVVPLGFQLVILSAVGGGDSKNGRGTIRLVSTAINNERVDDDVFIEQGTLTINDTTFGAAFDPPKTFPGGTIVKMTADATANGTYLSGTWSGILRRA